MTKMAFGFADPANPCFIPADVRCSSTGSCQLLLTCWKVFLDVAWVSYEFLQLFGKRLRKSIRRE
jgi:hypothetical protein